MQKGTFQQGVLFLLCYWIITTDVLSCEVVYSITIQYISFVYHIFYNLKKEKR